MKILLWIDDVRNPFEDDWLNFSPIGRSCKVYWVKSYKEAIEFLKCTWPDAICFDHDLGEEKTGYDIAKFVVEKCLNSKLSFPKYSSQSANPIGRENILKLLNNYRKYESERMD